MTLGDEDVVAVPGTTTCIRKGARHGAVNHGERPFSFIWVIEGDVPTEDC